MKRKVVGCVLGAAFLASPALAQSDRAQKNEPTPLRGQDRSNVAPAQHGDIKFITINDRNLWRASKLDGVDVYNDRNEKIGEIDEVLLDRKGQVEAVIIGVGGFLGLGERHVAVPFNALRWQMRDEIAVTARTSSPMTGANRVPPTTDNVGDVAERSARANPEVRENLARNTVGEAPDRQRGNVTTGATQPRENTAVLETGRGGAAGRETTGRDVAPTARENTAVLETGQRPVARREPVSQRDAAAPRGERVSSRAMADAPARAILAGATKEMLQRAPEFKYADR